MARPQSGAEIRSDRAEYDVALAQRNHQSPLARISATCKRHLNPNGVFYYNTTFSDDVPYTAAHVFKHVIRVANLVAASESSVRFERQTSRGESNALREGWPSRLQLFPIRRTRHLADRVDYGEHPHIRHRSRIQGRKNLWLITDDNMAAEFKRARSDASSGDEPNAVVDRRPALDGIV